MAGRTSSPTQREKWKARTKRYREKLRALVDVLLPPGQCFRCKVFEYTELAHTKPTGGPLGRGRGCAQRYRDVLNNPDSFVRLCIPCHRAFDAGKVTLEMEDAPF